jgi:hypothetical protein
MSEPRTPRPALNQDDAGFPPLRNDSGLKADEEESKDNDQDLHEDEGGA